ncbi:MAG TPA: lipopolysaccharide biosynthesis protein [Sphingomicrobium sp.]|nr:lipopolysaccharide biosynthesis protein [Sphingomicrobium sp.]
MSTAAPEAGGPKADLAALARGGRINFFGFCLRLAARLPFLFIAGRFYGPEILGRFAYAIIVIELAAQLATIGLKRGLAQQLAKTDQPHVCVVFDGLLAAFLASAVASAVLMIFPQAMFPAGDIMGAEWLLPLIIFGIAGADIALAALAYRHDVASTVQVRAIVEPITISVAAGMLIFLFPRDGLIIAYVVSIVAGLAVALWRLIRNYGLPHGWKPHPGTVWSMARQNFPLAAADAIEWGSRRLDIAILGLFVAPYWVGIYYIAQNVASLPAKLKTSFDPILAPVVTNKLAEGDLGAVAKQVRQVGFWVISAQAGIAFALAIPGEAVMGLVGPAFVSGTAALAFLLFAEVVAATAAVSEAALVYVARLRNLAISLLMIVTQAALTIALILAVGRLPVEPAQVAPLQIAAAGVALMISLALASVLKAKLLRRILGAPVQGWRWSLIWAAAAAVVTGSLVILLPEWAELIFGIPAILLAFGAVLWVKGFGKDDRELFRMKKEEIEDLQLPPPGHKGGRMS